MQLINWIYHSGRRRGEKRKIFQLFSRSFSVIRMRIAYENRMANRLVDTQHTFRK